MWLCSSSQPLRGRYFSHYLLNTAHCLVVNAIFLYILRCIIYLSHAKVAFNEAQLQQLLRQASSRNQALDVTSMLLYGQEQFLQVLERQQALVQNLYDHIQRDPRHRDVTTFADKQIAHRFFEGWATPKTRSSFSGVRSWSCPPIC